MDVELICASLTPSISSTGVEYDTLLFYRHNSYQYKFILLRFFHNSQTGIPYLSNAHR